MNYELIKHTLQKQKKIIVGFSGGPDSIALLHILLNISKETTFSIIAAHLNHEWRESSKNDLLFCENFCKKQEIPFVSESISNLSSIKKFAYNGSKEEEARFYRRYFLESLAKKENATGIALAHHANDQIETFFIRLARGTSLAGLPGIKQKKDLYIRPLLSFFKDEIMDYIKKNNLPYLIDPSNESTHFLRNRIRLSLVPILNTIDKRFSQNILHTMKQLEQSYDFLEKHTQKIRLKITYEQGYHIASFLLLHSTVQNEMLKQIIVLQSVSLSLSNALFHEIIRFLSSQKSPKHVLQNTTTIFKKKGYFFFA